jgi:hypothetical protein
MNKYDNDDLEKEFLSLDCYIFHHIKMYISSIYLTCICNIHTKKWQILQGVCVCNSNKHYKWSQSKNLFSTLLPAFQEKVCIKKPDSDVLGHDALYTHRYQWVYIALQPKTPSSQPWEPQIT